MVKRRFRFEPIDIKEEDFMEFQEFYKKLRKSINRMYKKDYDEVIPDIRKIYRVDNMGFPL